jgi:hypothetical protein
MTRGEAANRGGLFDALGCGGAAGPKRQKLGLFIAAVRALKRVDGRVSVGGVKVNDSASYCAAACWAGVIDNEGQSHVTSLLGERRTLKRVHKDCDVARTHGRLAMASQSNCILQFAVRICRDPGDLPNKDRPKAVRS